MPGRRTRNLAILQRRQQVADLYLQGWTQQKIADHLVINQKTVSSHLKRIRQEWRESAVRDFDLAREVELRKIDRVEREAWAAWERSQQPAQSAHINDETNQRRTRRHVRNQYGDPRFLEQVNKCIAMRCALLGLGAVRGEDGSDGFTLDERRNRVFTVIAALRDRCGAAAAGEGFGGGEPGLLRADREPRTVAAGPAPQLPGPGDP
jgi:hypothetical protein